MKVCIEDEKRKRREEREGRKKRVTEKGFGILILWLWNLLATEVE